MELVKNRMEYVNYRCINLRYMFVKKNMSNRMFDLQHVISQESLADILTNTLSKSCFNKFRAVYLIDQILLYLAPNKDSTITEKKNHLESTQL